MVERKVRRRKLDLQNLRFVPISNLPTIRRKTQWEEIFEQIPKGQALVLTDEEASPETVRSALRRYQKKGKFTHLEGTTRKVNGEKVVYILNPSPHELEPAERKALGPEPPITALPSEQQIFQYITSKPAFSHTLGEIQEHCFGGKLRRNDPKLRKVYYRLREQVLEVQRKIEREYGGKFESTLVGREKRFTFKETKKESIEAFA